MVRHPERVRGDVRSDVSSLSPPRPVVLAVSVGTVGPSLVRLGRRGSVSFMRGGAGSARRAGVRPRASARASGAETASSTVTGRGLGDDGRRRDRRRGRPRELGFRESDRGSTGAAPTELRPAGAARAGPRSSTATPEARSAAAAMTRAAICALVVVGESGWRGTEGATERGGLGECSSASPARSRGRAWPGGRSSAPDPGSSSLGTFATCARGSAEPGTAAPPPPTPEGSGESSRFIERDLK